MIKFDFWLLELNSKMLSFVNNAGYEGDDIAENSEYLPCMLEKQSTDVKYVHHYSY